MSAAQYWYDKAPAKSAYDISDHIRQSFWRNGLGSAWFRVTRAEAPYAAEGRWQDQVFTFEWEPLRYLVLRMPTHEKAIEEVFSRVLGFKPIFRYTDDGRSVVEWRQTGRADRWNELVRRGQPDLARV